MTFAAFMQTTPEKSFNDALPHKQTTNPKNDKTGNCHNTHSLLPATMNDATTIQPHLHQMAGKNNSLKTDSGSHDQHQDATNTKHLSNATRNRPFLTHANTTKNATKPLASNPRHQRNQQKQRP